MHVSRGGWSGQTFALAKYDESFEGKKSGIRRSKEERKGMIETYIKRYQKSNNGEFPSLNLTRKEVGGSFYTVREIVREIIQENRVLGPPKSAPGDQTMENLDSFLEQNPLGSISIGTQVLPEFEFMNNNVRNTSSITELHQLKLDSDTIVDGSVNTTTELLVDTELQQVKLDSDTIVDGSVRMTTELLVDGWEDEHKGYEVNEVVADQTQTHKILDLDVGPVTSAGHNVNETSSETEALDDNLEKDTENRELANGNNKHLVSNEMHLSDNSTAEGDINLGAEIAHTLPESTPALASHKSQNHSSTEENLLFDVNGNGAVKLADLLPAEEKPLNGANAQSLRSKTSSNSVQHPTLEERSTNLNKSDEQSGGYPQTRNPTLNRIHLIESWKAASRKSNGRESHPLVKFIKSFITAFVKFWTD